MERCGNNDIKIRCDWKSYVWFYILVALVITGFVIKFTKQKQAPSPDAVQSVRPLRTWDNLSDSVTVLERDLSELSKLNR